MKQATLISVETPEALAEGDEVRVYANMRNDGDEVSDFYIASFDITDPLHWDTFTHSSNVDGVQPGQTVSIPLKHKGETWRLMPAKELQLYIQGGYYEETGTHGTGIMQFEYYLTIGLTTEPAPQEGLANIWRVDAPTKLFPGDKVEILAYLENKGIWRDDIWCNLTDLDTGEVLIQKVYNAGSKEGFNFDMSDGILMPNHNFRLRLSAGHDGEADSVKDVTIYFSTVETKFPTGLIFGGLAALFLIPLMIKKK